MAGQAALTGHLVLSTLHTNDAPTAISRLLDLGMPAHLLKASLNGVMAQRLVRTLCLSCRVEVTPDQQAWQALVQSCPMQMPEKIYQPGGCLKCRNTGYSGRQGVYEIMPLSKSLIKTIAANSDIQPLRERAVKLGMKPLRLAGAEKVANGITSIEEVMRVTPEPES
jgi:general secretion pathway protein E